MVSEIFAYVSVLIFLCIVKQLEIVFPSILDLVLDASCVDDGDIQNEFYDADDDSPLLGSSAVREIPTIA